MRARTVWPRTVFAPTAALAAALTFGCVTEPSARHRDVPEPPADAHATSVQIFAAAPRDTNSNGFGDTISVTMYLFDEQRYPLPIAVPGAARFALVTGTGVAVASWDYSREDTQRALQSMAPGPGYRFELSLLAKGSDKIDSQEVLLTVDFQPVAGTGVKSAGGVALRLGKVAP